MTVLGRRDDDLDPPLFVGPWSIVDSMLRCENGPELLTAAEFVARSAEQLERVNPPETESVVDVASLERARQSLNQDLETLDQHRMIAVDLGADLPPCADLVRAVQQSPDYAIYARHQELERRRCAGDSTHHVT